MKVLFDHQIFFIQRYGGISRYFSRLAEGLTHLNQDVKILSGINTNAYLTEMPSGLVVGKQIRKFPSKSQGLLKRINSFYEATYESFYTPQLIHETYFGADSFKRSNAIRVVGLYDMIQEKFPDLFPSENPTLLAKKAALQRADHIISISQHSKDDCCEILGIDESKISVVHLAADSPFKDLESIELELNRPFFLYVGDRNGYKNFNILLKAFAQSEKLKSDFSLVSFGGPPFSKTELAQFESLGLTKDHVKYFSGEDRILGKLYSLACALVYPSLYEGFGIPPLEAMNYDCPVLASNTSCIPEIVGSGGVLFDPHNCEELSYLLEKLSEDSFYRGELIDEGVQRREQFSWGKTAVETIQVYKSLL
ncbi:glycosyltransferase family 4 protein [Algoriphagus vanfongensis]|uniref:glycosyltransferase family 4 protein n=1 Tax=Algoriphagus vanfongensis TaxID=426371 RepID=UPI0003FDCF7F|nr:glycosyltransferase family 1 protein [Algoriphagus vanfongensis]